ncbi:MULTISPECIES: protein kinase [Spirulina sp. CCY15215]|uniref:methylation-associated defense system protein kinase MAD6 n=1 Tax=Spirulina sp. CCY15215 TaxID=2767591 RepID=UPI001951E208|nr:protein kinase [Spirulina major]
MRKAKVIQLGEFVNQSERDAIAYLRNHLSEEYTLFTNLELRQGVEIFEIDLIIISPHCVFIVDIKNWHGSIEIIGNYWHQDRYQPIFSPLKKVRRHTKILSTLIRDSNHALRDRLGKVHIQAAILMVDVDIKIDDSAHLDDHSITYLDRRCFEFFQSKKLIPDSRYFNIQSYRPKVENAIRGKSRPRSKFPCYRDWQVEDKLSEYKGYKEYRAYKTYLQNIKVRLRVYAVDPWLEEETRKRQYELISNAYQALSTLPNHPNILNIKDGFSGEDADTWVLVFDDSPRRSLRQFIATNNLSLDRKLEIIQNLLDALNHAHKHGIIHRNITPDSILLTENCQAQLTNFDYARISQRNATIAEDIKEDLEANSIYQALECYTDPSQASITSDLFSAGLVFYELLMGKRAFKTAEELCDREAIFPDRPSQNYPELSHNFDEWLQKLCAFHPSDRFQSCEEVQQVFNTLNAKSSPDRPSLDLANLPPESILDDRYTIVNRLGKPGSFAVAYHARDVMGDESIVLKLVIRDRHSVYDRLTQEYRVLRNVPPHPHIVKVISAGQLKDDTPFITFEYVEGKDIHTAIENHSFSPPEALKIAQETLAGLKHLHQHKVYHQDIKPSNLILTETGIRIIDFNIALSGDRTTAVNTGTRPYIPPDFKANSHHNSEEKIDRDLYGLGITFYECVTGKYPFTNPVPSLDQSPQNLHQFSGCEDLKAEWNDFFARAISPLRRDRFTSATEMLTAIDSLENSQPKAEQKPPLETIILTPKPSLKLEVVLDPTSLYPIESNYIAIATEREWLQKFTGQPGHYWIKGKRLCNWTEAWLQGRDLLDTISRIQQSPSDRLKQLFFPLPLPSDWTEKEFFQLAIDLDRYPDPPIPYFLAELSNSNPQIWLDKPSRENLADWLSLQVPQSKQILERVWQEKRPPSPLTPYYQTSDKLNLLRQWLGIIPPHIPELKQYPRDIPDIIIDEFDR